MKTNTKKTITVEHAISLIEKGLIRQQQRAADILHIAKTQLDGNTELNREDIVASGYKWQLSSLMKMNAWSTWECLLHGIAGHLADRSLFVDKDANEESEVM